MNRQEAKGAAIAQALNACPPLASWSTERDELWLVVQSAVCTRGLAMVTPLGSTAPIAVTAEHATDELIAAMAWLMNHEDQARTLPPLRLFVMLRGVATRGSHGSGRAARDDALRGVTHVAPGDPVRWSEADPIEVAS